MTAQTSPWWARLSTVTGFLRNNVESASVRIEMKNPPAPLRLVTWYNSLDGSVNMVGRILFEEVRDNGIWDEP